ncbi:MAG: acyltransferase [bacterium]
MKVKAKEFFTNTYDQLTEKEKEEYHKTVFMNMDSPLAVEKRIEYYRTQLRHIGRNVKIGCGVKITNPQYISFGDNVQIGNDCVLIASTEKGITLDDGARLKYGVYLDAETPDKGYIKIGKRVYIGTGCCLHGHEGLEIRDDALLAQNITITPYSHKFDDPDKAIYSQGGYQRKVTIGRDCYIGMNVCVIYSADVGEGSVVGAGSVVTKTIPPYSVAVGVPARVIRKRGK